MSAPNSADSSSGSDRPPGAGVEAAKPAPARKPRILLVEDEVIVARDLELQLEDLGFEPVGHATRGEEAVELAGELRPDLVLMDVQLAGAMNGITAAGIIRTRYAVPVVFLSANFEGGGAFGEAEGADAPSIAKPFDEHTLQAVLRRVLGLV